jgi:hypothetical protein
MGHANQIHYVPIKWEGNLYEHITVLGWQEVISSMVNAIHLPK